MSERKRTRYVTVYHLTGADNIWCWFGSKKAAGVYIREHNVQEPVLDPVSIEFSAKGFASYLSEFKL